ncbi:MAG: FapA family protein, partial [Acetatifactor sp.]|nr:FapA family protein [Acetatifactor sp.]
TLIDGQVFVTDIYEVENVDNSTGNIEFEGSVQVNGNICSGFSVKAKGNVIVSGVVEGATVCADGDIVITRGMNGMSKGTLEAGGNIIAKFLENARASADGYVSAESILHSKVTAGSEITVTGRRGFITGGHVCAGTKVSAKNLGANMGASTVVEVGVNPRVKQEYQTLQNDLLEIQKVIQKTQPILTNFAEKRAQGMQFSPEQVKYVRSLVLQTEAKKKELEEKSAKWEALQAAFEGQNDATVEVMGEAFPGTVIVIKDVSMSLRSSYQHCRFKRIEGEVRMVGL